MSPASGWSPPPGEQPPYYPYESPTVPPRPMRPPTAEELKRWKEEIEEDVRHPRRMVVLPHPVEPELHPTHARAYALMAAAQLTSPNSRPNADDLSVWRRNVLHTAEQFVSYILFGSKTDGGSK